MGARRFVAMIARLSPVFVVTAALLVGSGACSGKGGGKDVVTTGSIGPAGGELVTASGIAVVFPAGAVDETLAVVITETSDRAPGGLGALTRRVRFEPEEVVFAHPVAVRFPLPGGADAADVYWSRLDGAEGFDDLEGVVSGDTVTARVVHFGEAFLGETGPTRTVVGSAIASIESASPPRHAPDDLTGTSVRAFVAGSGGALVPVIGTGFANGTFTLPGVPPGEYFLQVGGNYFVTTAGAIDLGASRFAREDALPLADPASANVHVQLSGMVPWTATDTWQFIAPSVDDFAFGLEVLHPPTVGATDLDETFSGLDLFPGGSAIESAAADPAWVAQLVSTATADAVPYRSLQRLYTAPPFDFVDGQTATLTGAFSDVSGAATATFDMRNSEFWSHRSAITPDVAPQEFPGFFVVGQPGGTDAGPIGGSADYVLYTALSTSDTIVANAAWGEIPGDFGTAVYAGVSTSKTYLLPTTTTGPVEAGVVFLQTTLADAIDGPIAPRLTPVRSPEINGSSLFLANSGVGLTPTISWDPPVIGAPTQYVVKIRSLTRDPLDSSRTKATLVGFLTTSKTSVTLPPGMLAIDGSYLVKIRATDAPFPTSAPSRTAFPVSKADTLSGIFSPASKVFVTSAGQGGNLGGLSGADQTCTNLATAAGLGAPAWKAWVSDGTANAIDRIEDAGPWYAVDGRRVFVDKASLLTGPEIGLNITELGTVGGGNVWTGTATDGTYSGQACSNWTDGSNGSLGTLGSGGSVGSSWTGFQQLGCGSVAAFMYCFGQ